MGNAWETMGKNMGHLWKTYGKLWELKHRLAFSGIYEKTWYVHVHPTRCNLDIPMFGHSQIILLVLCVYIYIYSILHPIIYPMMAHDILLSMILTPILLMNPHMKIPRPYSSKPTYLGLHPTS
jgi:hypothetical protein